MVMGSILGDAPVPYSPDDEEDPNDPLKQQPLPPPPPPVSTGEVPFAAGQTPPIYGPPVPTQTPYWDQVQQVFQQNPNLSNIAAGEAQANNVPTNIGNYISNYQAQTNTGDIPAPAGGIPGYNLTPAGREDVQAPLDALRAQAIGQQAPNAGYVPTVNADYRESPLTSAMRVAAGPMQVYQGLNPEIPFVTPAIENYVKPLAAYGINNAPGVGAWNSLSQALGGPNIGQLAADQAIPSHGLDLALTAAPFAGGGIDAARGLYGAGRSALERSALEGLGAPARSLEALGGREAAAVQLHGGLPAGGSIDPLNHGTPDLGMMAQMAGGEPNAPGGRLYTPENEPYGYHAPNELQARAQQAYDAAYGATPFEPGIKGEPNVSRTGNKELNAEAARQEVLSGQTLPGNYSAIPQEGVMPNRNGTPLAYDPTFSGGSGYRETIAPPEPFSSTQQLSPEARGQQLEGRMNGEGQVVNLAVRPEAVKPIDNFVAPGKGFELTDPAGARVLGPGEQPGPGEIMMHHGTGNAGIQGDLRPGMNLTPDATVAENFARTQSRLEGSSSVSPPPPSPPIGELNPPGAGRQLIEDAINNNPNLSQSAQDFLRSQNGQAAAAQREAGINAGARPSETGGVGGGTTPPGATGGGTTAPLPPRPAGVNQNAWQQAVAVIRQPERIVLTGAHVGRVGVGSALSHPTDAATALRGYATALVNPEGARVLKAELNAKPFVGGDGPVGRRAIDFATNGPQLNKAIADKLLDSVPGVGAILKRSGDAGSLYLSMLRDSEYNTAAQNIARLLPSADDKFYRDTYLAISHGTGHSTGVGRGVMGAAQGVGVGPNAMLARFQNVLDVFTKSGAPVPWAQGGRAEAVRALMGTAGVIAATSAVGTLLGAQTNLPFGQDPTGLTNRWGVTNALGKVVTFTPDKAFKTIYSGGSGYDTALRLFANAYLDLTGQGDPKHTPLENLENHAAAWARGNVGAVGSVITDLLTGKDWEGKPYDLNSLKAEAQQGFAGRVAPIAAKSLFDAFNAWGEGGLLRASPALLAYGVETKPTTTTDQRNLVKDESAVPALIRGVNPQELGPRGNKALDAVVKQEAPAAQAQAQANQVENGNPVFTKYHETIDAANAQADQRKTDLYNALRDGKLNGEQLRAGREIINGIANNKRDSARNDPEYKDAISKLEQNDVNKALSGYYKIGDMFKTPDGKPDWDKIDQAQSEFVKFIEQNKPQIAGPFKFEITPQAKTNPLDQLYQAAQPMLARYGAIKDDYARSQAQRNNPKEDAFLALLGYGKTQSPQAAQILEQLRANLPGAPAPAVVGARGQGVAAPAEAAPPPAQANVAPPAPANVQPNVQPPAPTGATLPPVVANDTQQRQNFVNAMSAPAHAYAQTTGIPPAVWAAMGASESNWGRAQSIFGIMGKGTAGGQNYDTFEIRPGGVRENTNSQFAAYNNLDDAFKHFVDLTSTGRYAPAHDYLMQTGDWQGFLHQINQAGYATAPNWADSIISLTKHIEQTYPGVR